MSRSRSGSVSERLAQIAATVKTDGATNGMPWDPRSTSFPSRGDLPKIENAPEGAAWVWGSDDQLGRLNLLTPARVAAAAKLITDGDIVSLNLPLNVPAVPAFKRQPFQHTIKPIASGYAYDDAYSLNTQSGTQWDGFRHIAFVKTAQFYNGATGAHIDGEEANQHRCSIHHWSDHGIGGRGVLLDYWTYAQENGIKYDPYEYHAIPLASLAACGKSQGLDIRPAAQGGDMQIGDILLIRSGFVSTYHSLGPSERAAAALRPHTHGPGDGMRWAGISAEDEMVDWLHDSYFAAVAGDAPSFEAWPSMRADGGMLHEYILALWGMPLGELFDLEKLADVCRRKGRWTFFFSSAPANVPGGVASHANAQAFF
ncbi:hypothetical protein V493_07140 [Pseudogymnoascus sp. VKM F-4281 (FW-2241)]|nr:hypothetical protein V493_07140 [Pseudogymnoascus sp. VKM F-4281 (FW-2241)]